MPPASLLSLPREIRDQILDLCLTTPLPPPPPTQRYTGQPISSSVFIISSAQKKWQPLFKFPLRPQTNSGGLLLTCHQISAETRDALERLDAQNKLRYVMRVRIEEQEGDATGECEEHRIDWLVLPTKTWLEDSRRAKGASGKAKGSLDEDQLQPSEPRQPVNLVVQVEKTTRAQPIAKNENQTHRRQDSLPMSSSQNHYNDQEPPQYLSALFRRYHFLCRPELRPPLPPPPRVMRSLIRAGEHGVLLLHWTLGDIVARAITEGPCCFSREPLTPSLSSSPSASASSPPHTHYPQPRPFTLTLSCSAPAPQTASSGPASPTASKPLGTPILEFLPFFLHSAKLTYSPFRTLITRGLLRRFDVCADAEADELLSSSDAASATRVAAEQRWARPESQARCPVPGTCCSQGEKEKGEQGLHWLCDAVRKADEADRQRSVQVQRDYDNDW